MISKLKFLVMMMAMLSFAFGSSAQAIAGGLESAQTDDIQKQIEVLRSQINSLNSTVEGLKDENTSVKARSREMESELATLKGLQPGTEIAKSMENRVTTLEDKVGTIKISGALTGIVQSSVNRKINRSQQGQEPTNPDTATIFNRSGQTTSDRTIGAGSFDLYMESKILDNTRIYTNLDANSANQVFPSLSLPNGNTTFSTHLPAQNIDVLNVLELYVESQFYNDKFTATVGKIDLTNYFDGNKVAWDEHRQFLSGALLDNASFTTVVPLNTIGARGSYDIGWGLTAQAAVASEDNSGDKLFNQMFGIAEIDYQSFWLFGLEGNYRAYGYVKEINTFTDRGVVTGRDVMGLGYGLSGDQKLTDKLTIFARWGANQNALANNALNSATAFSPGAKGSWSTGGSYQGLLPNRPDDIAGGGFSWINPADPVGQSPVRDFNEWLIEFYYSYKVADNLHVSPVLQFLKHPNGDNDENITTIFGGRAFLEF
ncbi:MAG: carbohydrate porin [Candidatus Omnitrophica bacterium]|nr:carbohydrate porin [Candidatus Omnitrophota bacterium]